MEQYKQNPSLLKAVKQIFGDLVVDAFCFSDTEFSAKETNTKELILDWNSEEIVLVFSNGNRVLMMNSEWASFSCRQN